MGPENPVARGGPSCTIPSPYPSTATSSFWLIIIFHSITLLFCFPFSFMNLVRFLTFQTQQQKMGGGSIFIFVVLKITASAGVGHVGYLVVVG